MTTARQAQGTPIINQICEEQKGHPFTLLPNNGPSVKIAIFRFDTLSSRRDFIASVRASGSLDQSINGVPISLQCMAVISQEIAQQTDVISASAYFFHNEFRPHFETSHEVTPAYRDRELVLGTLSVVFHVNDEGMQIFTREGGEPCVDKTALNHFCAEKNIPSICDNLITFLTNRFPQREFHCK